MEKGGEAKVSPKNHPGKRTYQSKTRTRSGTGDGLEGGLFPLPRDNAGKRKETVI